MAYSIIGGSRFWQYRHDIVESIEKTRIAGFEAGLESLDESPVGVQATASNTKLSCRGRNRAAYASRTQNAHRFAVHTILTSLIPDLG